MADYGYDSYNTSYGNQGGADGGGFMAGGSQQSPGDRKPGFSKDTLRPATIRQLLNAEQPHPDSDFSIDGTEVSQVTFVGQVRNISKQTMITTFKIDDGTGSIEVKVWVDSEDPSAAGRDVVQDGYARVWGRLKMFANKKHVVAHMLRPITDYNEISYHLLEATAVHLHFKFGPPDAQNANQTNANVQQGMSNPYGNQNGAAGAGGSQLPYGTSSNARKVYDEIFKAPQTHDGLHLMDLSKRLNLDPGQVTNAANELMELGVIYTTCDEQTWAILEM